MRRTLKRYLEQNCTEIKTWLQPYQPTKDTQKPYGVIVFGELLPSIDNRLGTFRSVYIWPYLGGTSFIFLDEAIAEIKTLLKGDGDQPKRFETEDGRRFELEWVNEGRDFYDEDLHALTRRLEYRIPLIR